jgi:hypothetical protein
MLYTPTKAIECYLSNPVEKSHSINVAVNLVNPAV